MCRLSHISEIPCLTLSWKLYTKEIPVQTAWLTDFSLESNFNFVSTQKLSFASNYYFADNKNNIFPSGLFVNVQTEIKIAKSPTKVISPKCSHVYQICK